MPIKNSNIKQESLAVHKQLSYEQLVAAWFSSDGWEVLVPAIDHGKKTDLVVADDTNFYRIQVKTVESSNDSITVENKWKGAKIDYVIYFSRTAEWGYIAPAFSENRKRLNSPDHIRFHNHPVNFLKAFRKV
ncbi:group I intron-associated PD-(D/E)XK endonuclease [Methylomonas sp. OY6]|uniref:Group I intron-associated PD-(D/E)XK endonuclease n=1 Tax=Methylomonas defluvii TaxID=3045149 RepID=A0ABU4UEX3_9GAMM|nr:group I intron-associated PD-(D/E)XK endonuclease [Methylomonas sp. OY6]MDX8128027.1 group I intron-associated PD-(D/E)XK endonuclease [Methylomonas sp. OY6]